MALLDKDGFTHFWSKLKAKLATKADSVHTHTKSQITDFPTSMPASDVYSWAKASSKPSYAISEISGLQSALDNKASSSHTHDGRYYTEEEVNSLLNGYTKNPESKTYSMEYKGTNYQKLTKEFVLPSMNVNDNIKYTLSGSTYYYSSTGMGSKEVHVTLKLPAGGTYDVSDNIIKASNVQQVTSSVQKTPYSGTLSGGAVIYKADLNSVTFGDDDDYQNIGFVFSGTILIRRIS